MRAEEYKQLCKVYAKLIAAYSALKDGKDGGWIDPQKTAMSNVTFCINEINEMLQRESDKYG